MIALALALAGVLLDVRGGGAALPPSLQNVLDRTDADGLVVPLERYERYHRHASEAGEAALLLGQLHFARGEYRQAANAFMRASARLEPGRKEDARYWAGLAWLGADDISQARAALSAATRPASRRRPEALFAIATAWEREHRPDRALETLNGLLAGDPGPMGASALERVIALGSSLHQPEAAARARDRLVRDYPHSIEAIRASAASQAPEPAVAPARPSSGAAEPRAATPRAGGPFALQIGAFSDLHRARDLADAARRAGYERVRVASLGDPSANLYVVQVGLYATPEAAREAGARARRMLNVPWRVVTAP
jgi:tetratricopeptide (TPR) repeat protein